MRHSESPDRFDRRSFARRVAGSAITASTFGILRAGQAAGAQQPVATRVRVWSEGTAPRSIYPDDIDGALGDHLRRLPGMAVERSRLTDPEAGLSDRLLDATDVLVWWGRLRHADLPEARARAVADRVRAGKLGLVALHASCGSKPFQQLMGCTCEPGGWREDGRPERVTIQAPGHPIARGLASFTIPRTSMFLEPFQVPTPEAVVLVSRFEEGETFRSGLTWTVGAGRVAYFRPGHDAFPVLFHPSVRRVIANAVGWAAPSTA